MSLARDITTVGGGTLVSRLLAYVRDAWIAALLGTGPYSETLFAVLQVVNFFRRLLSEGALNSAFVPIWTKLRGSTDGAANADRFTRRALLMMFCVAGSIALLAVFLGPYIIAGIAPGFDDAQQSFAAFLLFMTAPYILLAGLVAVIAAALSADGRVGVVAVITVLFNLTMLLALLVLPDEPIERYQITFWIALAVTAAQRWPTMADVPTMEEAGMKNFVVTSWAAFVFPAGTPRPIIDKIAGAMKQIAADAEIQKRFQVGGARLLSSTPEGALAYAAKERALWKDVVAASGAKID